MTAPAHIRPARVTPAPEFRRSSFCANDACVEVAFTSDEILVRDGKTRQAPLLHFTGSAWTAFVTGVATGEFDRPGST